MIVRLPFVRDEDLSRKVETASDNYYQRLAIPGSGLKQASKQAETDRQDRGIAKLDWTGPSWTTGHGRTSSIHTQEGQDEISGI